VNCWIVKKNATCWIRFERCVWMITQVFR
jgi:hypothetical protein